MPHNLATSISKSTRRFSGLDPIILTFAYEQQALIQDFCEEGGWKVSLCHTKCSVRISCTH